MTTGLTKPVAGVGEDGRHLYTCPLCEAMCGLEIQVEDGQVASIRGNRDDTWSRGHICPKGATLGARARGPRPDPAPDDQGRRAVAGGQLGRGLPALHRTAGPGDREARHRRGDLLHRQPARALVLARPLHRRAARHVGHPAELLAGHRRPVAEEPVVAPDVRRLVELPGARHRAHRPARRDGRQPRRVAGIAARRARRDGHHRRNPQARQGHCRSTRSAPRPPRAPTSGCRSRRAPTPRCCWPSPTRCSPRTSSTLGDLAPHIDGLDRMREVAAEWSPERVAAVTDIDAERIRALARELAATAARGGLRPNRHVQPGVRQPGQLARRRRQHPRPATSTSRAAACSRGPRRGRSPCSRSPASRTARRSSAGSAPASAAPRRCSGQVPVSCLAEEIATPGEGQIKALITVAGNPVLSTPAGHKLDEVLPTLDAMIAVDLWLNETTRHADVILPGLVAAGAAAPRRPDPQLRDQQHRQLLGTGVRPTDPDAPGGVGDPDPADRAVHRHARRGRRRRRDRRRLLRLHGVHAGPRRRRDPQALRPRRARADPRPHAAHRTVRRPVRREPRRRHAGEAEGPAQRHQLRADGAAGARGARHVGRQDPAGPAVPARRPAAARRTPRPGARRAGPGQPAPPAVQQLVAAQRGAADEGQGPLHPADARRRRASAAACRPATSSR